jgi:protein-S-isoprenylcysteine O-methyltransferase Ste14
LTGAYDEERFLLEKYGEAYREYIDQTPRWTGMPKSEKKVKGWGTKEA